MDEDNTVARSIDYKAIEEMSRKVTEYLLKGGHIQKIPKGNTAKNEFGLNERK